MRLRTRFAPSPTGHLHAGNAYSALICQQWAIRHSADLLLRIEDIDHTRCREAYVSDLREDLSWLGLQWKDDIRRQSDFLNTYQVALEQLQKLDVIYPCFCTRLHIREEIEHMGLAPHATKSSRNYPGMCRKIDRCQREQRMQHEPFAWRLNMAAAFRLVGDTLSWRDQHGCRHPVHAKTHSDEVIGRKDIGVSYHLAVVVDDAAQGITHVIRGEDILPSTGIHRLLQTLLELPEPVYIHHPLLRDSDGQKLSKRYGAPTLRSLRQAGVKPMQLQNMLLNPEFDGTWHDGVFAT